MTDPLTDAVRRLKGLREDVERLKAAQSEEGEIRLFFASDELAMASDAASVRGQTLESATWNSAGYTTSTYNDGN